MFHTPAFSAAILAAAILLLPSAGQAAPQDQFGPLSQWTTLDDPRSPMAIAYPASVFAEKPSVAESDGRVFVSHDGSARLVVGTFANDGGTSLRDYRSQLLQDNYRDADLDYAPVGKRWFVISGTLGRMMFYERVNFSCRGQVINTWAMLYPVAERRFYDRVVEAVAPTFQASSGGCE
jgi:hypothetical protein